MNNKDLSALVDQIIKDHGINKTFIASQLKIHRQSLDNMMNKKSFSIDDANKILNTIGYEIENISVKKTEKKQ